MSKAPKDNQGGATLINRDEATGLIPGYISTQNELNLLEQENILQAQNWAKGKIKDVLSDTFIRELHKRMFNNVWKWAGKYRTSDKNIGNVLWSKVPEELRKLCADTHYWIENKTYGWDELGARFHHRLVFIHAFPNGNGRHARLMTDVLLESNGQEAFTWGLELIESGEANAKQVRELYIAALRDADKRNFARLIDFLKS